MSVADVQWFMQYIGPAASVMVILAWVIVRQQRMNETLQALVSRCEKWRDETED